MGTIFLHLGKRLSMFNFGLLGCSSYESRREASLPDVFPDNTCSNVRVPVGAGSRQTSPTWREQHCQGGWPGRPRGDAEVRPGDRSLCESGLDPPAATRQVPGPEPGAHLGVSWAACRGVRNRRRHLASSAPCEGASSCLFPEPEPDATQRRC